MRSRGLRLVLVGGLVMVGSVAVEGCSLNPQPEPPGSDETAGSAAGGSPTGTAGKAGSGATVGGGAGASAGTGGGSAGSATGGKAGTGGGAGKGGTGGASGGAAGAAGKGGAPPGGSGGGSGAGGGNQGGSGGASAGGAGAAGTTAGTGGASAGGAGSGGKAGASGSSGAAGGAGSGGAAGGAGSGGSSGGAAGGAGTSGAGGAGAGGAGAGGAGAGGAGAGGAGGAGGAPACDAIAQSGCTTPATKCSLSSTTGGATACFTPSGTAAKGDACAVGITGQGVEVPGDDTCAAGLLCSGLGNSAFNPDVIPPAPRVCRELCSVTHPCGTDEVCADVTGQGVGLCVPTCTLFDDTTCAAGTCAALGIDVADDASTPSTLARPICRRTGTVANGDACSESHDCGAGAVCTTQNVCRPLCDGAHACATGTCTLLDLVAPLDGVGVCQ